MTSIFQITLRHAIWRVTMDGRFFGDYRSRSQALAGVAEARVALDATGRTVSVIMGNDEGSL